MPNVSLYEISAWRNNSVTFPAMAFAILLLTSVLTFMLLNNSSESILVDVQQCTKTGTIPNHLQVLTQYASSLITCSFVCKDNPDCKTFGFTQNTCLLYWANIMHIASYGGPTSMVTCTDDRKPVCPRKIDTGNFTCTYSQNMKSCYCISRYAQTWMNATDTCYSYGMKLISVETSEKNSFLVNFINQNIGTSTGFWTSGQRIKSGMFIWKSTGTAVDITINYSLLNSFAGDNLAYSLSGNNLVWDNRVSTNNFRYLCEFQV